MKRKISSWIIVVLSLHTYAQVLTSVSRTWNVLQCQEGVSQSCQTLSYIAEGDTLIDSRPYFKLYLFSDSTRTQGSLIGGIRYDGKKMFYTNFNEEKLISDFSAEKNDTIMLIDFCSSTTLVVDSVDSVEVGNQQKKRILFNWSQCNYTEEWIDGIGSSHGVLHSLLINGHPTSDMSETLLCYLEDATLIYKHPTYDFCYVATTDIHEKNNLSAGLPVDVKILQGQAIFSFFAPSEGLYHLLVWDIQGKVQIRQDGHIENGGSVVNMQQLAKGLYFYRIIQRNTLLAQGRINILADE